MAQLGRRYLVHVRIGKGTPALNRIKIAAEGVQRVLESLTIGKGNCQLAYTSHDGASFGFLIKTTRYASAIRAPLESPGTTFDKPFAELHRGFRLRFLAKTAFWWLKVAIFTHVWRGVFCSKPLIAG